MFVTKIESAAFSTNAAEISIKCKASIATLVAFLGKYFVLQAYKNTESSNGEYSRLHKLHQFYRSNLQRKPLLRRAHYDVNPSIPRHTRIDTIYCRTFHLQVMRRYSEKD